MRTIKVAAGIGDNVWLLQKLVNTGEKFIFELPDGKPQRGKQIFDILPKVAKETHYVPNLSYKLLKERNIQRMARVWSEVKDDSFFLCMNEHLEKGKRIERFLPDLKTSFTLPWSTTQRANEVRGDFVEGREYIGIYGSSYSTTRAWGFWQEKEWFELIRMIHAENPKIVFVLIGAQFDMDLSTKLGAMLDHHGIGYIDTVGKELSYVVEVMKVLRYAFYFPSGLPILSQTVEGACDCFMFMPNHLSKMIGTYRDPDRPENSFKEAIFCTPERTFNWFKYEYNFFG